MYESDIKVSVTPELLDAIATFPTQREVRHCGTTFAASPLDIYATCPVCGTRLKVRSFASAPELEDVFDAVLAWMLQPSAEAIVRQRMAVLASDADWQALTACGGLRLSE